MEPPTRRSQPNLTHHTLTPLTTTLPAPTHSTSRSTSYLAPTTLPSLSPSILSRSSSRTRLRPAHPRPIPASTSLPVPGAQGRRRRSPPAIEDEGWLIRTASHLAEQSLEEKGHSWLATRESSTSLANNAAAAAATADLDADDEYDDAYSPAFSHSSRIPTPLASRSRLGSRLTTRRGSTFSENQPGVEEVVGPDFVDLAEEEDEELEVGEEEVDESEMRKVVMGRVGGWVDWAVGWMDFRDAGDVGEEDEGEKDGEVGQEESKDTVAAIDRKAIAEERRRRKMGLGRGDEGREEGKGDEKGVGVKAPEGDVGVLGDAKWLVEVAKKIVL